jgi:hypothetical protein
MEREGGIVICLTSLKGKLDRCSAEEDSLKGILKILKPFKVRSDVMFYLTVYTVLYV